MIAGTMTVALILPILIRPPRSREKVASEEPASPFAAEAIPGDSAEG
jgi:hypothetical protein